MQYKTRTRYQQTAALAVIVVAATLTALLIGLFGRTAEPGAQITDGTSNTGVAVTDGWMHNDILNPPVSRGVAVTDGWMHNDILNPPVSRGVDVTDGWMHNDILNPPVSRGVDVTDGWMHNDILNPPADDEISEFSPGR